MAAKKKIKLARRKKTSKKRTVKRIAVPFQFGPFGAPLTTHYFDSETGDTLGAKPNPKKYKII